MPFRESKLTRLFQNYFVCRGEREKTRQGKITMFVNVSNNASVFDETLHVLKFSALTSKVGGWLCTIRKVVGEVWWLEYSNVV